MTAVPLDPRPVDPRNIAIILSQLDKMVGVLNGQLDTSNIRAGGLDQDSYGLTVGYRAMTSQPVLGTSTPLPGCSFTLPAFAAPMKGLLLAHLHTDFYTGDEDPYVSLSIQANGANIWSNAPARFDSAPVASRWNGTTGAFAAVHHQISASTAVTYQLVGGIASGITQKAIDASLLGLFFSDGPVPPPP